MEKIKMQDIEKLADKYQVDVVDVIDLLQEGFTLEEAEEIIYEAEM